MDATPLYEAWAADRATRRSAPPVELTYVVTGRQEVHGAAPGERVNLALTEDMKEVLVGSGALSLVVEDDQESDAEVTEDVNYSELADNRADEPVVKED